MPARGYRYYSCPEMPKLSIGQEIATTRQLALPWGDATAHSSVEYLGLAMRETFERYKIQHQIDVKMDVIWQSELVHKVLRAMEFSGFYHREAGYWLVMAGKREARTLFQRLKEADPPIRAEPGTCDVGELLKAMANDDFGSTTGGHFSDLLIDKVNAASLHGSSDVSESDEWTHYAELGSVSAINVRLRQDDTAIMVTADRLVLVMSTRTEAEDLRIAEQINALIADLGLSG